MTTEEILSLNIVGKNIAVIGMPASGKSYLATRLAECRTHKLVRTDDFIYAGFEQSMYLSLEAIKDNIGRSITEGIQCYRLLRKCLEISYKWPDMIISCERPKHKRHQTYRQERETYKIKNLDGFELGLKNIFNKYLAECQNLPTIVQWDNNY